MPWLTRYNGDNEELVWVDDAPAGSLASLQSSMPTTNWASHNMYQPMQQLGYDVLSALYGEGAEPGKRVTWAPGSDLWTGGMLNDMPSYMAGDGHEFYEAVRRNDGSIDVYSPNSQIQGGAETGQVNVYDKTGKYTNSYTGTPWGGHWNAGLWAPVALATAGATGLLGGPAWGAGAGGAAGAGAAAGEAAASGAAGSAAAGATTGAGLSAAELAAIEAGQLAGVGAPVGAEALAAYSSLASPSLEAMAAAMGMTPEAFSALGASGVGAAGAAAGMTAGTSAASSNPSWMDLIKSGASKLLSPGSSGSGGFDWSSLVGPAINAAGGAYSANQAGKAADAQIQAAREAMALNEPFRQGGMKALNRLQDLLGLSGNTGADGYGTLMKDFSMSDFQADPGYAFRQSEGEKALQRAASAAGLIGSGKYLKDSMKFNQDLASQEYGSAYNRYQTNRASKLNPLQSLMGSGQTAANTVADYATQAGNAQAAGRVGQANALTGALTQGYSMYQNQQQQNQNNALMQAILAGRA